VMLHLGHFDSVQVWHFAGDRLPQLYLFGKFTD